MIKCLIPLIIALLWAMFVWCVPPCHSLELESSTLIPNIIKSLKEEPDHWIIRSDRAYYINGFVTPELRKTAWPEFNDNCIVYIMFEIMRENTGYMVLKKPIEKDLSGDEERQMRQALRQAVYEELHNRYHINLPKKEIKINIAPEDKVKPKVEVDEYGLKPL